MYDRSQEITGVTRKTSKPLLQDKFIKTTRSLFSAKQEMWPELQSSIDAAILGFPIDVSNSPKWGHQHYCSQQQQSLTDHEIEKCLTPKVIARTKHKDGEEIISSPSLKNLMAPLD